jgi:6-phosphogluconolactonase
MLDSPTRFLAGTYSDLDALAHQPYAPVPGDGIYTIEMDVDGSLTVVDSATVLNPAVLIPHPENSSMYAILETIRENGRIVRFEVDGDGRLDPQTETTANGKSTCYLAVSPQRDAAILINYWDAIIDVATLLPNGDIGPIHQSFRQVQRPDGEWRQVENREDHWGNRQVGPHAHCAHFWHDWVFIPDLGENAVFQYRWDAAAKTLTPETHIAFEDGSGPRHMAMHPTLDVCYVSNELFNTVCAATLDATDPDTVMPRLIPFQYESTLDNRDQVSYVSEIRLSDDARHLYVSNRGDNSIAVFDVDDAGRLSRTAIVPTEGKFPRHFSITPCGNAVVVANQDSGRLRVFRRDRDSGALEATEHELEVPAPNYIRFLPGN